MSPLENVQTRLFIMNDPFSRYMKMLSLSLCYMIIVIISILQSNVAKASTTNSFNGLLPVFEVPGMSNWTNFLPSTNTLNSTRTVSTSSGQKVANLPPPIEQQIPPGVNISDPNVHIVWKNVTVPSASNTQKNATDTKSTTTVKNISRSTMVYSFNIVGTIVSFFTWIGSVIIWIVYELIYHTGFLVFIVAIGILVYLARSSIFASRISVYEDEDALYKAIEHDLAWLKHEKRNILEAEDMGRISSHKMKKLEKFRAETKSSIQEDKDLLKLMNQEKKRYKKHVKEERKKHLNIMKEFYHRLKRDLEREKKRARIRYRVYGHMYRDSHDKRPDPGLAVTTVRHNTFLDRIYKYWENLGSSSKQKRHRHAHKRKNCLDTLDPTSLKFILLHHLNDSSLKQELVSSISQDLGTLSNPTKKLKQMMIASKININESTKFPVLASNIESIGSQSKLARYQQLFSINKNSRSKSRKKKTNNNLIELAKSKSPEELKQLLRYMQLRLRLEKDRKVQQQSPFNLKTDNDSIEQKIRHVLDEEELAMTKKRLSPTTLGQLQSNQSQ